MWSMSGFVRIRFAHLRICQRRSPSACRRRRSRRGRRGPQALQRPKLVLRERLRRVEVERTVFRLTRERVENRQVERERLAARRPRRDDHMLAALRRLPRFTLVGEERVVLEPIADPSVDVLRNRREPRQARTLGRDVRDLIAFEQLVPDRCLDRHVHIVPVDSKPRGASWSRLRADPSNLIRVMPAKGGR